MTPNRWAALAIGIFALGVLSTVLLPQVVLQRTYWKVPLDSLAIGHKLHTHTETKGIPLYAVRESDGDVHIRLASPDSAPGIARRFIVVECTPKEPCDIVALRVAVNSKRLIIVQGITRRDPEHAWWEIHPLENWRYPLPGE